MPNAIHEAAAEAKSKLTFLMRRIFFALLFGVLTACATAQGSGSVEHGFDIKNAGDTNISSIVVSYGRESIKFCRRYCVPTAGSFYGVYMPIQEEMQVTWQTADGQTHQTRIPVRSKVKDLGRLRTLYLQFTNDRLTVVQGLEYTNPSLVGRELFPLFP